MRRLVTITALVLAGLIVGLLVVPSLIPWNEFRDRGATALGTLTGRQVVIDGDVNLTLLPAPTLSASSVRLLLDGEVMGSIDRVEMQVRPWPLLLGDVQIENLRLEGAELRAFLPPDGPARWPVAPQALGGDLNVAGLSVQNTQLLIDRGGGHMVRLTDLSGELSAGGPDGPFELTANGLLANIPVRTSLQVARRSAKGALPVRLLLSMQDAKAEMRFTGQLAGADRLMDGDLTLQGPDAGPLIGLFRQITGQHAPDTATGPAYQLRGRLSMDAGRIGLDGIDLQWGASRATGSIDLPRLADGADGGVILAFTSLDMDALTADTTLSSLGRPAAPLALDLLADQAHWRGDILRDLKLTGNWHQNRLSGATLAATLPGATELSLIGDADFSGDDVAVEADMILRSVSLRDTLAWAGLPVDTVPVERLRQAGVTAHVSGKYVEMTLTGVEGTLDTTGFKGDLSLSRRDRPGLGLRLTLDRLDMDAYRLPDAPPLWPDLRARLADIDINAAINAGQLQLAGLPVADLAADIGWTGQALTIRQLSARDVAGLSAQMGGHLAPDGGGNSHLTATLAGSTLAPLLRAMGNPDPVLAERLGPVTIDARLVGDAAKLAVDIRADALGGTTHIGGAISNPSAALDQGNDLDLKIRMNVPETADPLRLILADWRPAGALGTMDFFAAVAGPAAGPLAMSDLQGTLAGQQISGGLVWTPAKGDAPARIEGDVSLAAFDADRWLPALTKPDTSWSLQWTRRMSGQIGLTIPALSLVGEKLRDASLRLAIAPGQVRWSDGKAIWRDGQVTLAGAMEQTAPDPLSEGPAPVPSANLSLTLANVDLPPWFVDLVPGIRNGRMDAQWSGTAVGGSISALTDSLTGDGMLALRQGILTGIDLTSIGKVMGQGGSGGPAALRAAARKPGDTGFDTLSASVSLAGGVSAISAAEMIGPAGTLTGAGRWRWTDRTIDLTLTAKPAQPKAAPALGLHLTGSDLSPLRTLDLAQADAWMAERETARLARQAQTATTPPPPAAQPAKPPPVNPGGDGIQGILDRLKGKP